ncbi:MAG: hypothetical protein BWY83_02573 [bacterium ADurb.Bin478]|nr:MAG: hypothetical protein BWY83_02573 [bacterium ADurb.Bin478]
MLVGELFNLFKVGEGEGLSADKVGGGLHAHKGDFIRTVLLDKGLQLFNIQVALERQITAGLQRRIKEQLVHGSTQYFEMGAGGGKMIIHRDHIARFDQHLGDEVFGRTPLMRRQHVLQTKDLLDRGAEFIIGFRTGIGVIGHHHGSQLMVAHGVGAAVGEHIEKDIPGAQQKGVVAALRHGLESLPRGYQVCFLYDLDLVHFHGYFTTIAELDSHLHLLEFGFRYSAG